MNIGVAVGILLMMGGVAILIHAWKYPEAWKSGNIAGFTRKQVVWCGVVVIVSGMITAVIQFFS